MKATNLFRLADHGAGRRDWTAPATRELVEPTLADRFVNTGLALVGVPPDPEAYRAQDDCKHVSGALADVVLAGPPWIDDASLARFESGWRSFIDHAVAYGFNGVVVPGFLEYVIFDRVGDGFQVYAADRPYRARNNTVRERVGRVWKYADDVWQSARYRSL